MEVEKTVLNVWERNRVMLKGFLVGVLILIMLIPGAFIASLVNEREARQHEVVQEVSNKWAKGQTVMGPVILLPYKLVVDNGNGTTTTYKKMAFILPDQLQINGSMEPEIRHRSLFSVMLYRSDLQLNGKFNALPISMLQIAPENILWSEARLAMGVDDVRGLEDEIDLNWNGNKQIIEAGVPENNLLKKGFSTPIAIAEGQNVDFSIRIKLRGSEHLYFTPVGKTTEVSLKAPWKNPSFEGEYIPTETPAVDGKGFNAKWKILPMSRNTPQYWKDNAIDMSGSAFGVKLIQPVDGYAKTQRAVKYAILFVALTFTFFFFLEILQRRHIHALQYILVGMALSIFYTLLLSISEYTGFNAAYFIAAIATILLITMYVWSIFKKTSTTLAFATILSGLYCYIFILIQLQDYALLVGSIGLFIIVAFMMYYSRKIDWYGVYRHPGSPEVSD